MCKYKVCLHGRNKYCADTEVEDRLYFVLFKLDQEPFSIWRMWAASLCDSHNGKLHQMPLEEEFLGKSSLGMTASWGRDLCLFHSLM